MIKGGLALTRLQSVYTGTPGSPQAGQVATTAFLLFIQEIPQLLTIRSIEQESASMRNGVPRHWDRPKLKFPHLNLLSLEQIRQPSGESDLGGHPTRRATDSRVDTVKIRCSRFLIANVRLCQL